MKEKFDATWYNLNPLGIEKLKMDISHGITVESLSVGSNPKQDSWSLEYYLSADKNLDLQEWKIKCFHQNANGNPTVATNQLYLKRKENQWTWYLDSGNIGTSTSAKYIDISSTPFTNYFPIMELMQNNKCQDTFTVLFVEVPKLEISLKKQTYKKIGPREFSYKSDNSQNVYPIKVDDNGMVIKYGNIWQGIIE